MTLTQVFPYSEESVSGILQFMKENDLINENTFSYSSIYDNNYLPSFVLSNDNKYFCTKENTTQNANFLVMNLSNLFLFPKGYIIKGDPRTSDGCLRTWKLFGSLNGKRWTQIHSANNDDSLKGSGIKRYQLFGGPFKLFKIVQTGPSFGQGIEYTARLRVAYIDFFGSMTNRYKPGKTCRSKQSGLPFSITLLLLITKL